MGKQPSFQFYPGDWKKDAGVQALSYEERGVWFELMLMMFESPERGKLVFRTGTPIPEDAVARALGLDKQKVNQILSKLLDYGVASKEENTGIIYCRRMVRDAELSKKRAECGKLGGNPNLLNQNESKIQPKRKQNPTKTESKFQPLHLHLLSSDNKKEIEKERTKDFSLDDFLEAAKLPDVAVKPEQARECFDFYAAQGFLKSNGQPITAIAPLLRAWKRREGMFTHPTDKNSLQGQNSPDLRTLKLGLSFILGGSDNLMEQERKALRCQDVESFKRYVPDEYQMIVDTLKEPFSKMKDFINKKLKDKR